jgi:hypothetical protein
MKAFKKYKLVMLNPVSSNDTGWFKYGVEMDKDGYGWSTFKLADCHRVIDLNFSIGNTEERRAALVKLDKLLTAMKDFRNLITRIQESNK